MVKMQQQLSGREINSKEIVQQDKLDVPARIMVGNNNNAAGKQLHKMIDELQGLSDQSCCNC